MLDGSAEALFKSWCAAAQSEEQQEDSTQTRRETQTELSCYHCQTRSGARKRRLSVFTHSKKKGKKRGKRAKIDMEVSTSNTFSGSLTLLFVGERTLRRLQLYT